MSEFVGKWFMLIMCLLSPFIAIRCVEEEQGLDKIKRRSKLQELWEQRK